MEGNSLSAALSAVAESLSHQVEKGALARIEELLSRRVEPRLLTVEQAGQYIGRSKHAVELLIHKRELPVVRVGRRVHLDRQDLDRWIEGRKQ